MRARGLLVGLAGVVALVSLTVEARAAAPRQQGWWSQLQSSAVAGLTLPAPPGVPEDGLFIAASPAGETAMAALRFELDGARADVLTLEATDVKGTPTVGICAVIGSWVPEQNGPYARRPPSEADGCRPGTLTGTSVRFETDGLVRNGALDVAIVAGRAADGSTPAFQLTLAKPGPNALQVADPSTEEPFAEPPPAAAPADDAEGTPSPPEDPALSGTDDFAPAGAAPVVRPEVLPDPLATPAVDLASPRLASDGGGGGGVLISSKQGARDGLTIFGLIGFSLLMGAWYVIERQPDRGPRMLTSFRPSGEGIALDLDGRRPSDEEGT